MANNNHAYLAVNVRIGFPEHRGRKGFAFKTVSTFNVESSWKRLTDVAEFVVAKQLCFADQKRVFELVKPADPFFIEAGYNGNFNRYFSGFISEVLDDLPVLFKGEDNMYVLKRTIISKHFKSGKLETFLKSIIPSQFKINAMNVDLGELIYSKQSVTHILTELKDNYGIYSYFVGDTLVSGKIYTDNPRTDVVRHTFFKNILPGNDLRYRHKDDVRIKVTMTSHLKKGKRIKKSYGEDDGEEQKLVCSGITDEAEILKLCKKEYERLKIDGWRGSFIGFGIPFVQHGYTDIIKDPTNPDKDGQCYIDSVRYTLDDHGALRQHISPGPKAAVQ